MVLTIGKLCVKTAGREANKVCCVVDVIDKNYVLIDGDVKRRKCNIAHLEPLPQNIDIPKGADTSVVLGKIASLNISIKGKKAKKIETAEKPVKKRKGKTKKEKENK